MNQYRRSSNCLVLFLFVVTWQVSQAQICSGSFGDPIFEENFGSGGRTSLPAGRTDYTYVGSGPVFNIREYTVFSGSPRTVHPNWLATGRDHTGDANGRMAIFNADAGPGVFYRRRVDNLCPGTTMEFSAWIANVVDLSIATGILPNVTFRLRNAQNNAILGSVNTGNIPESTQLIWREHGFTFQLPTGVSSVIVEMDNNVPTNSGAGNDLAIDDIVFRVCGPRARVEVSHTNICTGTPVTLTAQLGAGLTTPAYQWQRYNTSSTSWENISGANGASYTENNPVDGARYRYLVAADAASLTNRNCRSVSQRVTLTVSDLTCSISGATQICSGGTSNLRATPQGGSGPYQYRWSTGATTAGIAVSPATTTTYSVTVTDVGASCSSSCDITVQVGNPTCSITTSTGSDTICLGSSIQLTSNPVGGSGNYSYLWSNLESTRTTSPLSPTVRTEYLVMITDLDWGCTFSCSKWIEVVNPMCTVTGPDTICRGATADLTAQVSGGSGSYTYQWSSGGSSATEPVSPSSTTSYDVTITEVSTGCIFTCSHAVYVETIAPDLSGCNITTPQTRDCGPPSTNEANIIDWHNDNLAALAACATDNRNQVSISSDFDLANYQPSCGGGSITVEYLVSDHCNNATAFTAELVVEDVTPPDTSGCNFALRHQTLECQGASANLQAMQDWHQQNLQSMLACANDACGGFSVNSDFDPTTFAPSCGSQAGTLSVTYTLEDPCANALDVVLVLTIEDTTPPDTSNCNFAQRNQVEQCRGSSGNRQMIQEWHNENLLVISDCVRDQCADFQVTSDFSVNNFQSDCGGNAGRIAVRYSLEDDCNNRVSFSLTLVIEDTEPVDLGACILTPKVIECSQELDIRDALSEWHRANLRRLASCAADRCDTLIITSDLDLYQLDWNCTNGKRVFEANYVIAQPCGALGSFSSSFTVIDEQGPILVVPRDTTIQYGSAIPPGWYEASDYCGAVKVTYEEQTIPGYCACSSEIIRVWTARDRCGNATQKEQHIFVVDTLAPEIVVHHPSLRNLRQGDIMITYDCFDPQVQMDDFTITDDCQTLDDSYDIIKHFKQCESSGYDRVWECGITSVDLCGNSSLFVFYVAQIDTTAPKILHVPDDMVISCGDTIPEPTKPVISVDNCQTDLPLDYTERRVDGEGDGSYLIERTWEAVDDCGNRAMAKQEITVCEFLDTRLGSISGMVWHDQNVNGIREAGEEPMPCHVSLLMWDGEHFKEIGSIDMEGGSTAQPYEFIDLVPGAYKVQFGVEAPMHFTKKGVGAASRNSDVNPDNGQSDLIQIRAGTVIRDLDAGIFESIPFTCPPDTLLDCLQQIDTPYFPAPCVDAQVIFEDAATLDSCGQGFILRTWIAENCLGEETRCVQRITIASRDIVPAIICPDTTLYGCDPSALGPPRLELPCGGEVRASHLDEQRRDVRTGHLHIIRQWRLASCGRDTLTCLQNVVVIDTVSPVLVEASAPTDTSVMWGSDLSMRSLGTATYRDDCDQELLLKFEDDTISFDYDCQQGLFQRRIWAEDYSGNAGEAWHQTIRIEAPDGVEREQPVFPADTILACDQPLPDVAALKERFGDTLVVSDRILATDCGELVERTFVLHRHCEVHRSVQMIQRVDTIAPLLQIPASVTLPQGTHVPVDTPDVVDCSHVTLTLRESLLGDGTCGDSIERIWIAMDGCGNTTIDTQLVFLTDDVPPHILLSDPEQASVRSGDTIVRFDCPRPWTEADFVIEDVCATTDSLSVHDLEQDRCEGQVAMTTLRLVSTDVFDNRSSFELTVRYLDTVAPVIDYPPRDTILPCDAAIPEPDTLTAVDACQGEVSLEYREDWHYQAHDSSQFLLTRTWMAEDVCGNTTMVRQAIRTCAYSIVDSSGVISGLVWQDLNRNDLRDSTEMGVDSIAVHLYAATDTTPHLVEVTQTGISDTAAGTYTFANLPPGDYRLQFNRPDSFEFTRPYQGEAWQDCDVINDAGWTDTLTLHSGSALLAMDAGIRPVQPSVPPSLMTSSADGCLVTLDMEVVNQQVDSLVLQRSMDGHVYHDLASWSGPEVRGGWADAFTDTMPQARLIYRLRTYAQGVEQEAPILIAMHSPPCGVARDQISLVPNPARSHVDVLFQDMSGHATVTIFDLLGRPVRHVPIRQTGALGRARISLEGLPPASYLFHIHHDGRIVVRRMVKL